MAKVSVIIPAYNAAAFIEDAVHSALNQSYAQVEVIVVDDGSKDDTAQLVEAIAGAKCLRKANGGVSSARNFGVAQSSGEYIAFLDADDIWHADKIAAQVALLDRYPDADLTYCRYEDDLERFRAEISGRRIDTAASIPHTLIESMEPSFVNPYFGTSCVMVRRSAFERVGGFDRALPFAEDVDFYLKVLVERPSVPVLEFPAVFKRPVRGSLGDNSVAGYEMLFRVYDMLAAARPEVLARYPKMVARAHAELQRRYASSLLSLGRRADARRAARASLRQRFSARALLVLILASLPVFMKRALSSLRGAR